MPKLNPNFLVNLRKFANTHWPNMRIGHSIWASDPKYPCANPDGPVDNSDCGTDGPFCMCPCQELIPDSPEELERINAEIHGVGEDGEAVAWSISPDDMKEPTDEELDQLKEDMKECGWIEQYLNTEEGDDWRGCIWNDTGHPSSCNCPCVGNRFKDYMEYTKTYSTYWDTPNNTPLWRNAQMQLINAQKCVIVVNGDFSLAW